MTTAHHGTPITPEEVILALTDPWQRRHFCVSFYRPDQVTLVSRIAASWFIDNGAFSAWRKGIALGADYWSNYWPFVERWLAAGAAWFVIPDIIDEGSQVQDAWINETPASLRPWAVPVWHMDEPMSRLSRLVGDFPRVCIGSTGEYAAVGSPDWRLRMTEAFNMLCPGGGEPPVAIHMLRGMQCELPSFTYPFDSVDSTHLARNHNRLNRYGADQKPRLVRDFADRWDRLNCPKLWVPAYDNADLFSLAGVGVAA